MTSRTDEIPDTGLVDRGFHYFTDISPLPDCELGITLGLSTSPVQPGDTFTLTLETCNNTAEIIPAARVYLVMDIYGLFFFWPSWTTTVNFQHRDLAPGLTTEEVLSFTWPDTGSSGQATFIAAMTDQEFTETLGTWDIASFTWE